MRPNVYGNDKLPKHYTLYCNLWAMILCFNNKVTLYTFIQQLISYDSSLSYFLDGHCNMIT